MLIPIEAFKLSIEKWEGLYQADPVDVGNVKLPDGTVVGTMRGVTPGAWAQFLNRPIRDITPQMMKAISLTDAARVYEQNYYQAPGFAKLEWGPSVDIIADIGWGSGPRRGALALQNLCGVPQDGAVGPKTVAAHKVWLAELGDAGAINSLYKWRAAWYNLIVQRHPSNRKFLKGWLNRAKWQTIDGPWWEAWSNAPAAPQPEPVPSAPERQILAAIDETLLDRLAHEAAQEVLNANPALAVAVAMLRRLFG